MLKYFDDFIGKNLGFEVFLELLFYFSINMSPVALPLAILISSLMTYGKLGEHFELIAIKSVGISLVRTLYPTFILILILSIGAYYLANDLVPFANLRAYSLLYDIKHKKPALDLNEGQFYGGIPEVSIKVNRKFDDGIGLEKIIIYDHKNTNGNKKVILADSGRMYTFINERYLMLELYYGNHYIEERKNNRRNNIEQFTRTKFKSMKLVYSLASFDLGRTNLELFAGNCKMKTSEEIAISIDSMKLLSADVALNLFNAVPYYYKNHLALNMIPSNKLIQERNLLTKAKNKRDSLKKVLYEQIKINNNLDKSDTAIISTYPINATNKDKNNHVAIYNRNLLSGGDKKIYSPKLKLLKDTTLYLKDSLMIKLLHEKIDKKFSDATSNNSYYSKATSFARNIKSNIKSCDSKIALVKEEIDAHSVEKYKKHAIAFSCIMLFLIGAPLGAIIKKGGLGVPIIVAVIFFIIFYVIMIITEKWAKSGVMNPFIAAWMSNIVLMPFGIFFLRQARLDARVFDVDIYLIWIDKLKEWLKNQKRLMKR